MSVSHLLKISFSSCSDTNCPKLATNSVEQGGAGCAGCPGCAACAGCPGCPGWPGCAGCGACAAPGEPRAGAGSTHAPSVRGVCGYIFYDHYNSLFHVHQVGYYVSRSIWKDTVRDHESMIIWQYDVESTCSIKINSSITQTGIWECK